MPIDAKRFRAKARMVRTPTPENAGATRNGARVKRTLPMEETMGYRGAWTQGGIEPLIDELLSDPIVVAVMRRDGLRPEDVRAALHECRRRRETGLLWSGLGNRDSLTQFVRMLARIGLDSEGSPLRPRRATISTRPASGARTGNLAPNGSTRVRPSRGTKISAQTRRCSIDCFASAGGDACDG